MRFAAKLKGDCPLRGNPGFLDFGEKMSEVEFCGFRTIRPYKLFQINKIQHPESFV